MYIHAATLGAYEQKPRKWNIFKELKCAKSCAISIPMEQMLLCIFI